MDIFKKISDYIIAIFMTSKPSSAPPNSVEKPMEFASEALAPMPAAAGAPTVAIINMSTVLTDTDLMKAVAALQIQVTRDYAPIWGRGATLQAVAKGQTVPKSTWQIHVMDDTDQAGALGYHELTPDGFPIGYIFAKTDIQNKLSWSVTLSHELLEMLTDPDINLTAFVQTSKSAGTLYAYEVCDPSEDDIYGYLINGIRVSDFVYPEWFESFRAANSVKFNYSGKITHPFQLLPGGYISVFKTNSKTGWTQVTAEGKPGRRLALKLAKKKKFSRTDRR